MYHCGASQHRVVSLHQLLICQCTARHTHQQGSQACSRVGMHPPDGGQGSCHVADLTSTVGKHDADGGEDLQPA
jgi:hypothetical protein